MSPSSPSPGMGGLPPRPASPGGSPAFGTPRPPMPGSPSPTPSPTPMPYRPSWARDED